MDSVLPSGERSTFFTQELNTVAGATSVTQIKDVYYVWRETEAERDRDRDTQTDKVTQWERDRSRAVVVVVWCVCVCVCVWGGGYVCMYVLCMLVCLQREAG